MPRRQSLQVDYKEEHASQQVTPRPPLLSSHHAGWQNIGLQYHTQPAMKSPDFQPIQHVLVIHLKLETKVERNLGGHYQWGNNLPGDITVIPANVNYWIATVQESEVLLLTLNPQFVSHLAHESIKPERVEIVPHFAQSDPLIYGIGQALKSELESDGLASHLYAEFLCNALSMHLLKRYSSQQHTIREYSDGLPRYNLIQVLDYINTHLDQNIKVAKLAEIVEMSRYYFDSLFKQSIGISPYQYVLVQRVERAKQLLKQQELLIPDVALACGFANQSHFTKCFRQLIGVTPKAYREKLRE